MKTYTPIKSVQKTFELIRFLSNVSILVLMDSVLREILVNPLCT